MVADDRTAFLAAGQIAAGRVLISGNHPAVRAGACENVVTIGLIAAAAHDFALFVQRGLLVEIVSIPFHVAVQIRNVVGDQFALGVIPGPGTDTIASVDRLRATIRTRAPHPDSIFDS